MIQSIVVVISTYTVIVATTIYISKDIKPDLSLDEIIKFIA